MYTLFYLFFFNVYIFLNFVFIFFSKGVRLDRVRGGRQKYKRRPEVENATYQSAPLQLTKETEKGGIFPFLHFSFYFVIPSGTAMAKEN